MFDLALHPRIIAIEEHLPRLREIFRRPELVLAYLYGSYAKGHPWTYSDVDIAVLFDQSVAPESYLDHKLRYIDEVTQLLHFENIDIQELNGAPVEFSYRVIRDGLLLYARSEEERARFEAAILEEYLDFRPVLDTYYRHLFQRLKEGRRSAQFPRYCAQVRATIQRSREAGGSSPPQP
ncbi:MAG: nucleotidyltransferase domain-containing protein [Chloroflexi bacterium]|nr:nucleotidyltransferase domain-containing protein [Chloroflexota bacterium]